MIVDITSGNNSFGIRSFIYTTHIVEIIEILHILEVSINNKAVYHKITKFELHSLSNENK